jgi:hypothetical protein
MATNRDLFRRNRASKMEESQQLFLGVRLVSKEFHNSAIQTKIEENFGRFCHLRKVRQPIGRKDSKQTVIPTRGNDFLTSVQILNRLSYLNSLSNYQV